MKSFKTLANGGSTVVEHSSNHQNAKGLSATTGSTVVGHLAHHSKVKGSSTATAAGTGIEEMVGNVCIDYGKLEALVAQ
jgi:hypothetical protein